MTYCLKIPFFLCLCYTILELKKHEDFHLLGETSNRYLESWAP